MKTKLILIIALIMAIITTVLFRQYVINLEKKYRSQNNIITIVVPKVDIKKNQLVSKDMLEFKEVSSSSVHPQALKKFEEVVGKYAVTDIKSGEVLLPLRFTDQYSENQTITRKIQSGNRAVSIGVSDVKAVSKLIEPEDYVDVIYTVNGQTSILLENIRVIAVGKSLIQSTKSKDNNAEDYGTVTLEVSPTDAVKIINADETGNIKFVLRGQLGP